MLVKTMVILVMKFKTMVILVKKFELMLIMVVVAHRGDCKESGCVEKDCCYDHLLIVIKII